MCWWGMYFACCWANEFMLVESDVVECRLLSHQMLWNMRLQH
jgi:hypothetical protein